MKFYKGMDISTITEVESLGGKFYDHGVEKDVFEILKSYGTNAVRLRLWNDPYAEDGTPYGAGTNDLPTTIELTKRAKAHGMEKEDGYTYGLQPGLDLFHVPAGGE